ncbi:hephaestin [Monodelphis domestica]|uniref:hephaestin n=1 Tax=Monodelphis domestica TaxID=13616 RepID=UPI0024E1DD44|nr:hephaestin [Monodelphis domestica]XP_056665698.1 hephaestin [Monodelphis domestica]
MQAMGQWQLLGALLSVLALWPHPAQGATREYYVGIREVRWNYSPKDKNVITGKSVQDDKAAAGFLEPGKDRIGNIYHKAVYKEYSDSSYTTEVPRPAWLGFLGPVLRGEVGDVILVHLKNFARRPYTIHPHGVFYEKDSEGSLYPDGTSGRLKADDAVPSGGSHTYNWTIPEGHAPTHADPACLTWIYHSHVDAPRDIASGLIGPLITCKRGTLAGSSPPRRQDVDRDFFLLFSVVDENLSWFLEENIASFCKDPASVDREDETFLASNKMHAINGFVFGNLPELSMCAGEHVAWHLFGMGNEVDVHTAFFPGQVLTVQGHHTDVASLFPATFVVAQMVPRVPGTWLLSCQVNSHLRDGMQALYEVKPCSMTPPQASLPGRVRQYFIGASEESWDYGPTRRDGRTGKSLQEPGSNSEKFFQKNARRIGGSYWKVRYIQYTDETFQTKLPRSEETFHLGIMGPVIKAEVGDTIEVVFYNRASRPFSIQPHGVFYDKDYEGTVYNDGSRHHGLIAQPFEKVTYRWMVPPGAGPSPTDPACLTWMYFSAVDPVKDTNSGLVGPLLVCKVGSLGADGKQKGVDKEFFLLFTVFDENDSWYSNINKDAAMLDQSLLLEDDQSFLDSNKMHAINGFTFSNLPALAMCQGDTVAWHFLSLGTETDVHGATFEGHTIQMMGMRKASASLFPHTFATALMQPDTPGTFEIYCQEGSHLQAGMRASYNVSRCQGRRSEAQRYQVVRTYYIMAEEMEWDYCPNRTWEMDWHNQSEKESYSHVFLSNEDGLLGSQYKKVVYREYNDGTFRTPRPRTGPEEHLGILGPLLRGEVGDILTVVFKNNASRPYSVGARGVLEHEAGSARPAEPGEIIMYQWYIPERSGPGPNDSACIPWLYYSDVDPIKDMYSGLVGPLVICQPGTLTEAGRRKDVGREFALLFLIFDENQSWYLEENVAAHGPQGSSHVNLQDENFLESNKMHAINGKLYANLKGLTMYQGDRIGWYMLAMGQDIDLHTVHFHAESFLYQNGESHRADVVDLFPGTFEAVEMVATNPGTWLMHCHVADHVHAGMETLFTVLARGEPMITITTGSEGKGPETAFEDVTGTKVKILGMEVPEKDAETLAVVLVVVGLILLIIVVVLAGVLCYQQRQRNLRRNRRSILDDSFKLLSLKQ